MHFFTKQNETTSCGCYWCDLWAKLCQVLILHVSYGSKCEDCLENIGEVSGMVPFCHAWKTAFIYTIMIENRKIVCPVPGWLAGPVQYNATPIIIGWCWPRKWNYGNCQEASGFTVSSSNSSRVGVWVQLKQILWRKLWIMFDYFKCELISAFGEQLIYYWLVTFEPELTIICCNIIFLDSLKWAIETW